MRVMGVEKKLPSVRLFRPPGSAGLPSQTPEVPCAPRHLRFVPNATLVKDEIARWAPIIKAASISR